MKKAFFAALMLFAVVAIGFPGDAAAQNTGANGAATLPTFSSPGSMAPNTGPILGGVTPTVSGSSDACAGFANNGLRGVVNCLLGYMNIAVTLIMAAAIVVIVWGAFLMISSEEKRESGKQIVIYGIFGLFAMVSIWGFVNILDSTFHLSGGTPIAPPRFGP
jgi:hypothetical protein